MVIELSDVFGIRTELSEASYIDRGGLDKEISKYAVQNQHIALKGESKTGKSWLRQKAFPGANVVPCRLDFSTEEIYRQILSNLDISLTVEKSTSGSAKLAFEGASEIGWKWLAKARGALGGEGKYEKEIVYRPVGKDEFDFAFLASVIKVSEKRIVIEDFHYLSTKTQRHLAHELKTFWDYGVYVVIIGVWHRKNFLTYLNSDIAGRIQEISVYWSTEDLKASIEKGARALNVQVTNGVSKKLANDSFNNIGILQSLTQLYFEHLHITEEQTSLIEICDIGTVDDAGMAYADQIEAVYSLFAEKVSDGIRKRRNATQIYAYAMQAIVEASDEELIGGLSIDRIFEVANSRQPRIQKPNLRTVLSKFQELQIDDRGKGLVLNFDESTQSIIIVDRGLLFYRKYMTAQWPWERLAEEAQQAGVGLQGES